MYRDDRVEVVVLAPQQHLELGTFDEFIQFANQVGQFGIDRLSFPSQFDKRFSVFNLPGEFAVEFNAFLESSLLTQNLTRFLVRGPEVRSGNQRVEPVNALLLRRGVKETSGVRGCGP